MDDSEVFDVPEPTKEESKSIKAILKSTVHQICSGQVVLSLAIAVKELVENSIDAGATLVEIKLKDHGLESVEVADNGHGVSEGNIEDMTAKYHTSKLREFTDLQGVDTFGFRGEALSSLCSLSDMSIATRHASSSIGIRVDLDHDGKIKKKTPCARQVGTTVTLTNLFSTLPVRKREFARNIKKEYSKMCHILQGYGLVSKGVRIICSNYSSKGSKSVVMATSGSNNYVDNIQAIFGSKQLSDIVELKSPFGEKLTIENLSDPYDQEASFQITNEDVENLNSGQFKLEGWISSCDHGKGRGSKDRQYFFVNSRPCDPKNVAKIVNQIYHRYNHQQNPFVFLNIVTDRSHVDVNLTPDKRQILVNNEKILLIAIKKALLNTFGHIPSRLTLRNTTLDKLLNRSVPDPREVDSDDEVKIPADAPRFHQVLSQWKATGDTKGATISNNNKGKKRKPIDEISARTAKMKKIQSFLECANNVEMKNGKTEHVVSYKSESDSETETNVSMINTNNLKTESEEFDKLLANKETENFEQIRTPVLPALKLTMIQPQPMATIVPGDEHFIEIPKTLPEEEKPCSTPEKEQESLGLHEGTSPPTVVKNIVLDTIDGEGDHHKPVAGVINTSIEEIRRALQAEETLHSESSRNKMKRLKFKSRIDPSQNKTAEQELSLEISKDMFSKMDIIGQFNLGFIIVRLGSDLLIVDQHATDEKYNFEELQHSTVLQYQPLTVPQTLEMTAECEMILMDNVDIFEKNGFKFQIDEEAPATKRVKLLGKPFSKNWEFGKDDIDELVFMLQNAPRGILCRPSRIRAMFASRACRKSIMIGTALPSTTMRTLINHMGEIDQPWNCPHGRPTMRHLINVEMLQEDEEEDANENKDEKEPVEEDVLNEELNDLLADTEDEADVEAEGEDFFEEDIEPEWEEEFISATDVPVTAAEQEECNLENDDVELNIEMNIEETD